MKTFKFMAAMMLCLAFTFTSCDREYCASCRELNTGYVPEDFCGDEDEVDTYINELNSLGGQLGQNWNCSKSR